MGKKPKRSIAVPRREKFKFQYTLPHFFSKFSAPCPVAIRDSSKALKHLII